MRQKLYSLIHASRLESQCKNCQFSFYQARRQNMKVRTDIRAGEGVEFDLEDEEEFDEDSAGL
jgi:hypothetical protein